MELGACSLSAAMASRQYGSRNGQHDSGNGDRVPDYTALQSALVHSPTEGFSIPPINWFNSYTAKIKLSI